MDIPDGQHFDFVIVGSGFGGSVSALRLVEKGYRVLLLEKGRRFRPEDFPESNWQLRRWMWAPALGWRGLFKMTFFRHVTVLSGVGVGGGSLVYANTLPVPKEPFFRQGSWAGLADWQDELEPHYATAKRMLGATRYPGRTAADDVMREVARDMGREEHFHPTDVAVWFGEAGVTVPDPFFGGEGPDRTGCNECGGCMLGCRFGSKNTLDKNYLWLAERRGLTLLADTEVTAVRAREGGGYRIEASHGARRWGRRAVAFTADRVVLSGGVLGTVDLLIRMKADPDALPALSERVGDFVRTNSESLIGVVSRNPDVDFSKGVAITSILHTDEHSHVEPVRYPAGSNFFRLLMAPHVPGDTAVVRVLRLVRLIVTRPRQLLKLLLVGDMSKRTPILLYMRTLEGTLSFRRGRNAFTLFRRALVTRLTGSPPPKAFMAEATEIAERVAEKIDGTPANMFSETLMGIPTTAHILGGACIGGSAEEGVIGPDHQVYGYPGLYVVDGAAVSSNPGVNPSLTITAMAERAMSLIPAASAAEDQEIASSA